MTDRYYSLTVVLDKEIRQDDCQSLIDAILMMKRVIKVIPHIADASHYCAMETARYDMRKKLWEALEPK
jgi:hypothetical protein